MDLDRIRNTSIIAHIDHGKSTLADRMLELMRRRRRPRHARPVPRLDGPRARAGHHHQAPERPARATPATSSTSSTPPATSTSATRCRRSLAACEGVILLVDAAQGIEAQTLANCYLALENDLEIVACAQQDRPARRRSRPVRRRDRAGARHPGRGDPADQRQDRRGGAPSCSMPSSSTVPPPEGDPDAPLQALIFDSPLRPVPRGGQLGPGGERAAGDARASCASCRPATVHEADEIGVRSPDNTPVDGSGAGEVGYLIAGIKDVGEARSGETVTTDVHGPATMPLDGLPRAQADGVLRPLSRSTATSSPTCARRSRSCASTTRASPTSPRRRARWASASAAASSVCSTWRSCGSGSSASSDSSLIATAPSVEYHVDQDRRRRDRRSTTPARCLRPPARSQSIAEPYLRATIITPDRVHRHAHGSVPDPAGRAGEDGVPVARAASSSIYRLPLAEVVIDFFDQLKSRTQGYASLDYEPDGYAVADLVKVDILLHGEPVDAFSIDRAPRQVLRLRHDAWPRS